MVDDLVVSLGFAKVVPSAVEWADETVEKRAASLVDSTVVLLGFRWAGQ